MYHFSTQALFLNVPVEELEILMIMEFLKGEEY